VDVPITYTCIALHFFLGSFYDISLEEEAAAIEKFLELSK
jgi:hypothetical protein